MRGGRSVIQSLHQSGSLKVLFPRSSSDLQAVMINTAGGVTGGDRFEQVFTAGATSELTLTTQAAERAYRAQPGQIGRIATHLKVGPNARANWLPQETILFDGRAMQRTLTVNLADTARLTFCEPLVFGRHTMGETLREGSFHDKVSITRSDHLLYLDAIKLDGATTEHLSQVAVADGAGAMVSLVHVGPDAEGHLAAVRHLLPTTGGASLVLPDVLVMRALAPDSFALRQFLCPILTRLTGRALPRPWMI